MMCGNSDSNIVFHGLPLLMPLLHPPFLECQYIKDVQSAQGFQGNPAHPQALQIQSSQMVGYPLMRAIPLQAFQSAMQALQGRSSRYLWNQATRILIVLD